MVSQTECEELFGLDFTTINCFQLARGAISLLDTCLVFKDGVEAFVEDLTYDGNGGLRPDQVDNGDEGERNNDKYDHDCQQ